MSLTPIIHVIEHSPVFTLLREMDEHLDGRVGALYIEQPLGQDWARVAKVAEEAGEAIQALIGITGQNPRKGYYSSRDELLGELAETAMTALLAIQHFTKDADRTREVVEAKALAIYVRMKAWEEQV